jgi:hypothetical protein
MVYSQCGVGVVKQSVPIHDDSGLGAEWKQSRAAPIPMINKQILHRSYPQAPSKAVQDDKVWSVKRRGTYPCALETGFRRLQVSCRRNYHYSPFNSSSINIDETKTVFLRFKGI